MCLLAARTVEGGWERTGHNFLGCCEVVAACFIRGKSLFTTIPVFRPSEDAVNNVLSVNLTARVGRFETIHLPDATLVTVVEGVPRKELIQDLMAAAFHTHCKSPVVKRLEDLAVAVLRPNG